MAIIQARMGSSRLPNKILMPVLGKPFLGWMLERVARSEELTSIVVATTTEPQDDAIEAYVRSLGHGVFRGSESDVLDRYHKAAIAANADIIVRLTSDCPLMDPAILDDMIRTFRVGETDFLSNSEPLPSTWPDGMDISIIGRQSLERAAAEARRPSEREHVTFFFWNNPTEFKCNKVEHRPDLSKFRITLDYVEDHELLKKIIEHFARSDKPGVLGATMYNVVEFLESHPDVFSLNAHYSHGVGWKPAFARDLAQGFGI